MDDQPQQAGGRESQKRGDEKGAEKAGGSSSSSDGEKLSWGQAVFLMTSDTIGLGLLLLPYAYAQLGFIWGTVVTTLFVMASSYNLYAMSIIKHNICPCARSLRDAAFSVGGSRAAAVLGSIVEANWVIGLMFVLSAGVEAAANINSIVVYLYYPEGKEFPSYVWSMIICVFMLPMAQIKSLSGASWFGLASTAALIFALGTAYSCFLAGSIAEGQGLSSPDAADSFTSTFGAWIGLVLVLQIIFVLVDTSFEVMSDMKDSRQFNSAQIASHAIAGSVCLGMSAGALYVLGPDNVAPYILESIHPSWQAIMAEAAVAFKATVTYVIVTIITLTGWYGKARTWARGVSGEEPTAEQKGENLCELGTRLDDVESRLPMPPIPEGGSSSEETVTVQIPAPYQSQLNGMDSSSSSSRQNPGDALERDGEMKQDANKDKAINFPPSKPRLGPALTWIAGVVANDKNLPAIWFVCSTALVAFTALVVGTFPYIDLIGSFLSALTGAPLVFGMPYYLLIYGGKKAGYSLSYPDAILSRAFLYGFMPALLVVGTIITVMVTLQRFGIQMP